MKTAHQKLQHTATLVAIVRETMPGKLERRFLKSMAGVVEGLLRALVPGGISP